jgi:hypothetical protein
MTFADFFSKKFLFDPAPTYESNLYIPLLIVLGLMIVFALLTKIVKDRARVVADKYFLPFLTSGILGFVYLFARYESLPYLGSRLFLVLIFTTFIIWNFIVSIKLVVFIPEYNKNQKTEEIYQKYLPRNKQIS